MYDLIMSLHSELTPVCKSIINISKSIQTVSIINKYGRLVEELRQDGLSYNTANSFKEVFLMQCVLQISMGRDFDEEYGPINYHVNERKNTTILTFPLNDNVILVITKKNLSPISLARKIAGVLSQVQSSDSSAIRDKN